METCRLSLLGAEVDLVTPAQVLDFVARKVVTGRRAIVANHNLHSLHLYATRADMRAFYALADIIEIDSTPMIAWGKLMGLPVSRSHRCTYLDFCEDLWALTSERGFRVYHLGCAPGVGEAARAAIRDRWPSVCLDVHHGYFDPESANNSAVLADIARCAPDILLVGMGMPRQETWILNNLEHLPDCVILPVGGAFDYEAGVQYLPPRWTGRWGVEWLARFVANPGRLFTRYFVEPWSLMPQIIGDVAWALSKRERVVERPVPFETEPWTRRQALSTNVPQKTVTPEPEAEFEPEAVQALAEPLRAAN